MPANINKNKLSEWSASLICIEKLLESHYGDSLLKALDGLVTEALYRSFTHGQGHIERTMVLAALIAQGEALSVEDTELLLLCAAYHDVGRINDGRDPVHGKNSARIIRDGSLIKEFAAFTPAEFNIALAAICSHSRGDSMMDTNAALFNVAAEDMTRFRRLTRCLKDADNLDRVRIYDLDVSRLRSNTAKKLPLVAERLFRFHYC